MVNKMEELANNKNERTELGKKAREVSLNYSSDSIKKEWLNLLKKKA